MRGDLGARRHGRLGLVARVAVAVLRSAGIHRRQLMTLGDERAADLEPLVREAFASLAALSGEAQ